MSVPYHRLLRVHPQYRWWRPLVALAIFLGFWVASQIVVTVILLVVLLGSGGADGAMRFVQQLSKDPLASSNPGGLAVTLVSLVLLLPSMMIAVRLAKLGPYGQLSSVRLRIRWGWMARCLLPLLVLLVLMVGIQGFGFGLGGMFTIGSDGVQPDPSIGHPTVTTTVMVIAIVMTIVLVPFQAAAEEYIFRGFALQTVGSWLRNPIPAILVSTAFFAVAHVPNGYNVWAIVDVGSFGCIAAILAWRTGGLEAGILAHALNNIVIFVLQAPGWSGLDTSGGDEGPIGPVITIVTLGIYALLVELTARRIGLDRRRPGREVPRFRGTAPAWAGSAADGWDGAPALTGAASGTVLHRASAEDDAVGGRP